MRYKCECIISTLCDKYVSIHGNIILFKYLYIECYKCIYNFLPFYKQDSENERITGRKK